MEKIEVPIKVQLPIEEVIEYLKNQDVLVEVVRCRDCKWWVKQKVGGVCQLNFLLATSDNWFCADGERKE